jgi:hypothetical protein
MNSCRPVRTAVVQLSRAGQARQVAAGNRTLIACVPSFLRSGARWLLRVPCGQVAWRASLPYHGQQPVERPGSTGNIADLDHPMMANLRQRIMNSLAEPR